MKLKIWVRQAMGKASKSKSAKKRIANFRLQVCDVILSNLLHMSCPTGDIEHIANIAELCDQYSLLIVLNWLATKYGFPLYKSSIQQDIDYRRFPLLSWASLANRYPLFLEHDCKEFISTFADLCSNLEQSFTAEIELAGDIYQQILSSPLRLNDDGRFYIDLQSDNRANGEFYTPAWVADRALNDWLKRGPAEVLPGWQDSAADRLPLVCDPACGSGNFLHATLRKYIDHVSDPHRLLLLAGSTIFGADLDGRALEVCKLSLLIALSNALSQLEAAKQNAAIDDLLSNFDHNVQLKDSLLAHCAFGAAQKYDLLISNPPYISFGSRDQSSLNSAWQKFLKNKFPASSEYKLRFTSIFQEIGIELSATASGHCIFLVPDAFLTGSFYHKLRNLILAKVDIVALTELPEDTIPGATVGRWCLAHYKKKNECPKLEQAQILLRSLSSADEAERSFSIPLESLLSRDKQRFQLLFSNEDLRLLKHMEQLDWLGQELKGHTGIRSRLGQAAIISKEQRNERFSRGLISGSQLKRFEISWREDWLEIDPEKLFSGGFDNRVIRGAKILLRQTGDSLIAAVDEAGLYHLNNIHSFVPLDGTRRREFAYYFCCILNSDLYRYLYRLKTREFKRALAQIDIETVEHMPLPVTSAELKNRLAQIGLSLSQKYKASLFAEMNSLVYELLGVDESLRLHIRTALSQEQPGPQPSFV